MHVRYNGKLSKGDIITDWSGLLRKFMMLYRYIFKTDRTILLKVYNMCGVRVRVKLDTCARNFTT